MFKNMKLGTKIATGFGALIVVAVALGGLAVFKMKSVEESSIMLAEEYVPEAVLASDLESRVWRTMYGFRGYGFTGEKKYYDEGMAALAQIKETLGKADELAGKAKHLVKLKGALTDAKQSLAEYERQVADTKKDLDEEHKVAETMAKTAKEYMDNAEKFLESQNATMAKEIAEGAAADKLAERLRKITLANDLIDLGNAARIANLQARARNDFTIMAEGVKTVFPKIESTGKELDTITRQAVYKQELKGILDAAGQYKAEMQKYMEIQEKLEKLNTARVTTGGKVLYLADELVGTATKQTHDIADKAAESLETATTTVIVGLAAALAIGVLLAFFITRSITKPIRRIIDGLTEGPSRWPRPPARSQRRSQSLAEGATEQAASIEETSSSLEEMSSMTKQNADNAEQADSLMSEAKQVVGDGQRAMGQLTELDGRDHQGERGDLQDHQDHRRDRLPDQPAGPERGGRGGAGRRGRRGVSRWWPRRCGTWPCARRRRPRTRRT